jgi:hypothetical protein
VSAALLRRGYARLEGFPSVTRRHVIAFLEEAKDRVIEAAP